MIRKKHLSNNLLHLEKLLFSQDERIKSLERRVAVLSLDVAKVRDQKVATPLPKKTTASGKHYSHMNGKGVLYHLNVKDVTLHQGRTQPIYFFSRDLRDTATTLPKGWKVIETSNGFLTIKRR